VHVDWTVAAAAAGHVSAGQKHSMRALHEGIMLCLDVLQKNFAMEFY
jgi:hypothetical protein